MHTCDGWLRVGGVLLGGAITLFALQASADPESPASASWQQQVQADIEASEYFASVQPDPLRDAESHWQAPNRAQGWRIWFRPEGLCVVERTNAVSSFDWRMELQSYGRPGAAQPVPAAQVQAYSNRVEYARDTLVEWYINSPAGLEQGFTLAQPPAGTGDVVELTLALPGAIKAHVSESRDAVEFGRPGQSPLIRYGQLKTVDADGRALRSWFAGGGDDLVICVEAKDARYPIVVDPLATSAGWTAESDQASATLGCSVAGAGDVNGDGYADVIVGARLYDNGENNEGRVYVYHGSASGLSATAAWTAEGNQADAYFGYSVAGAGDVNGDGYADVIVGAITYDNGENNEGRAYVYHGSASGLSATAAWTAESDQASAFYGYSVAGAGDVNGDGYADVIVSAYSYDNDQSNEGRVYVYHGSSSGLSATAAWTAESNQSDSIFGASVAGAGDVNGDGYADIIVGANAFDNGQNNEGRAFVYHGSASGLSATAAWTAESNQDGAEFGISVFAAGDVNGDGYADVIVGAQGYDNGQTDEGRAYVYHGSASGLSATAAWTAESNQGASFFGASVSGAGDVNGDGYADVIVGSIAYDNGQTDEGRAYVYNGSASGLSATAAWTAESDQAEAYYGAAVSSAGDVNGDGFADVIVGARLYDNGQTDEGRAFVYHGSASGLSTSSGWMAESDQADANFACIVSSAGDVNGDGYADVIVGAYTYDNGQANEGRAYVYHGSASGLSSTAAWIAESDQAGAQFGFSVASAGDVNGDGYADVIVGARYFSNGQSYEGRVLVYHGSASGLSLAVAWTAESDQAYAYIGYSVASAGDVNGDGYADVIVGSPYYSNGQSSEGRAYVYMGSASGLSASAAWIAEGDQANANFGWSVASAGDVNGDGFADIVIAAQVFDNGQADEGRAYVYHGSASGLSASAVWTAESDQASAYFGLSVASAGDVNGDGYADVIVGSPYYSNGQSSEGRAYVYMGSASGLSASAAWIAESDQVSALFGYSVASAGDVNGDGFSDVIIGAMLFSNGQSSEGRAFVYHGSASGLKATVEWTMESEQGAAYFGRSVASAGDVNGDGYADVIVGAPSYDNGQDNEGRAFLYYGGGGRGLTLVPQQRQSGSTAAIVSQGSTDDPNKFNLTVRARTAAGRSKVKLEWQAAPGTAAFGAAGTVSGVSAAWTDTGVAGVIVTQQVSGLASGTNYHWRLRLRYAPVSTLTPVASRWLYGPNGGAREQDLKTMGVAPPPAAPTALPASAVQLSGFTANWTAVAGATNYLLDVATDSGFTSYVSGYQNLVAGNVQTYAVAGLTAGQTYYYRVRAQSASGTGDNSAAIMVQLPPAAPAIQSATGVAQTTFNANWSAAVGATNYLLDVATDSGFASFVSGYQNLVVGNASTRTVSGLTAGQIYYYRVRTQNAVGLSTNSSTATVTTLPNAPSAPVADAASSVGATSFSANWNASAGATNYLLDVATDNGFTTYVSGYQNLVVGTAVTRAVSGLSAGQTYYYRVRAQNSGGTSGNSGTITVTTASGSPEIRVSGNGQEIASGDNSPGTADHTDFGVVVYDNGSSVTRTFTVQNTGAVDLTLGVASVQGDASGDFTITAQPAGTVLAGGQTTFAIRFDPSAAATRNATLQLTNNDEDESPYTFAINGRGIVTPNVFITNLAASTASGVATILVATTEGATYAMYRTDTLRSDAAPSWSVLTSGQGGDGTVQNQSDSTTNVMLRYYQVAVEGNTPSASNVWGVVRSDARVGYTLMAPAVRTDGRFDGVLGQSLAATLSGDDGGVGDSVGDEIFLLRSNGSWQTLYLDAQGTWHESGGAVSTQQLAAGQGFWVVRNAGPAARITFAGVVGNSGSRQVTVQPGWNLLGLSEGKSLPLKATLATGNPVGGSAEEEADLLVLQTASGAWRRFMYVQGWGAPYDGNWFDLTTFQIATNRLEPGAAYYYLRQASGGATSISF